MKKVYLILTQNILIILGLLLSLNLGAETLIHGKSHSSEISKNPGKRTGPISISYSGPQTYTQNNAISPLVPNASGVASLQYGNAIPYGTGLNQPFGLAEDAMGNIYVADGDNSVIQKFPAGGGAPVQLGTGLDFPVGVAVDQFGNIYIADAGNYNIYEIPADGSGQITLSTEDEFSEPSGIAVDAQRNLYITNLGTQQVLMLPAIGGSPKVLASGFSSPEGIAVDAYGNVLVIDNGAGALKEIPAGGGNVITLASGFGYPKGVSVDAYGFAYVSDAGGSSVTRVPVGGGNPIKISTGYYSPVAAILDPSGALYVLEYGNNQVKKVSQTGGFSISPALPNGLVFDASTGTISGTPTMLSPSTLYTITGYNGSSTGTGTVNIKVGASATLSNNANLNNLVLSEGTLSPVFNASTLSYTATVANSYTNIVLTPFTADASATVNINGNPVNAGSPSSPVTLNVGDNTISITITAGDGVTTQSYSLTVIRLSNTNLGLSYQSPQNYPVNTPIAPLAPVSNGISPLNYGNPSVYASGLSQPFSIAEDAQGNVFVADAGHGQVKKIPSGGGNPQVFGTGFIEPVGVATDASGNVYVVDAGTYYITEISASGTSQIRLASGYQFKQPSGIAVDAAGNVYVSNSGTNQVIKIPYGSGAPVVLATGLNNPQGLAVDGMGNVYEVDNGTGSLKMIPAQGGNPSLLASGFGYPKGVFLDGSGNLYVSDAGSSTIYRVPMSGGSSLKVSTMYTSPVGVVLDPSGSLYVLEYGTNQVKKAVQVGGYSVSPNLPSGLVLDGNTGIISGTPNVVSPSSAYMITGYNAATFTFTKAPINIAVFTLASKDAYLSLINVSAGNLSPKFDKTKLTYSDSLLSAVSSIQITPTTEDNTASITLNGSPIASNATSSSIPLSLGNNIITLVVTAQYGNTLTYTINAYRGASNITYLTDLKFNQGFQAPPANETLPYNTVFTASGVDSTRPFIVTPFAEDPAATITVNGVPVASGSPSQNLNPVTSKIPPIAIIVTAADKVHTRTYSVTTVAAPSRNDSLSNLTLSATSLVPGFSKSTLAYTASVPNRTISTTITPTTADPTAIVTVNGTPVKSGTASPIINLGVGVNTILVVVKAPSFGATLTYSIKITRSATPLPPLFSLVPGSGTLSPAFTPTTLAYFDTVANSVTSFTLTPTTSSPNATVKINGVLVNSGSPSVPVQLALGNNLINILATDSAGNPTAYTLSVYRAPSKIASLSNLVPSTGSLSPAFASGTTAYSESVSNAISSISLTPTTTSNLATVKINGTTIASGTASASIPLNVGVNTITTVVTAQDGSTTQTYTLTVTRAGVQILPTLSGISISSQSGAGGLNPAFSSSVLAYTVALPYISSTLTLTASTTDPNATTSINGVAGGNTPQANIPLTVGSNTITIVVNAAGGQSSQTYTLTVSRAPASNIATLSAIAPSINNNTIAVSTLSPAFAPSILSYTASVPNSATNITLNTIITDPYATATINGTAAGNPTFPLNVGANTFNIVVTAQDGITIKTYTLTVTKAASSDASLSNLSPSAGTLSPVFASGTTTYTETVPNATASITLTPITNSNTATVTVNGTAVASGSASASIALNTGSNTITTVVTAQDGTTTQTYTVTVNRSASTSATLSNLLPSVGTLSPSFSSGTTNYSETVSNITTGITLTPSVSGPVSSITVNGTLVNSGSASQNIPLNVGTNTATIIVTAQDQITTTTYTVTITRLASNIATLASLVPSAGSLNPVFTSGTNNYTESVGNTTTSITLTPTTTSIVATVTVNGTAVVSGSASSSIPLTVGTNTITTIVTAQDGTTTQTYTLTVTRAPSSVASLSNLSTSAGSLNPVFASGTTTYTESVPNATTSITLTPTTTSTVATVTVNGTAVVSGMASTSIPLTVGANTITIIVTAQDGSTTQTYTLTVNRSASSSATLSNLTTSIGTLSPVFASGTTNYTETVSNTTTGLTLTPSVTGPISSITVNGTVVASGSASQNIPLSIGANVVTIVVTAQDQVTTTIYTVTITRSASNVATLASLVPSAGTLNPVFSSGTYTYTESVNNATTSITLTPTTTSNVATVTVNGTAVVSGSASASIPLSVGSNTITTVVTAQDGSTTQTYTLTVTRAASNVATLASLVPSAGTLSPIFASGTNNYTETVPFSTSSITITPTVSLTGETLSINGVSVLSGNASSSIALNVGLNTISILVTAPDGITTQTYTLSVSRSASTDASLSGLTTSTGTLNPVFASATLNYTVSVSNPTTSISLTPTTTSNLASVKVNGITVASGSATASIPLSIGSNTITTVVTAQDGTTTQTYTLTVSRSASTDATLSSLTTSAGTLSPVFTSGTINYTESVPNTISSITLTPTTTSNVATVKVNGVSVVSGTASNSIPLNIGSNTITTVVTAQDGTTTQTYTLTVSRSASTDATLSGLTTSAGTLSPVFASGTINYTETVPNTTSAITITPTTSSNFATVTVNGNAVSSGNASNSISLNVGSNTIHTIVTAQDRITTQNYTITVFRTGSSIATLSNLSTSAGTLSPVFASGTTSYSETVSNSIASITVTPSATSSFATITVNGNIVSSGSPSTSIPLSVGPNTITTLVTAQDGITTQTYTLTVNRASSTSSSLSNLVPSAGTLNPVFSSGTTSYTESVSNSTTGITFTPTASGPVSSITVNGTLVSSGSASGNITLNPGQNTVTILVTAQDGVTTTTYSVLITRAGSNIASLSSLVPSAGSLNPVFASGTLSYTESVPNSTASITLTPTTTSNVATITINGVSVSSGSASNPINLSVGVNTINTVVTAQDGITTQTYTVVITRAPSSIATLSSLVLTNATSLSPAFSSTTNNYTASVSSSVTSIQIIPTATDPTATIKVNGVSVNSGTASGSISLNPGQNTITTIITAQDGSTLQTYTVVVTRGASSTVATLSSLSISGGAVLSPGFDPTIENYTANVAFATTQIFIVPSLTDPNSTVKVNGIIVQNGGASPNFQIAVGHNAFIIVVTAQDGQTQLTYSVDIVRGASGTLPTLSGLSASAGTISPSFSSTVLNYTLTVPFTTSYTYFSSSTTDPNAKYTINGVLNSGEPYFPLNVGANTFNILVTAQDGITTQTYSVVITRLPASNIATLSSLSASTGTLSPSFSSSVLNYTETVNYSVFDTYFALSTTDPTATYTINGTLNTSEPYFPLKVGANTFTIVVTAQDGITTKTYTVVITRQASASDASLASISAGGYSLSPSFSGSTTSYTATVPYSTNQINTYPYPNDPNAKVTVNGFLGGPTGYYVYQNLNVGPNTVNIVVTAQDGITTKTYTIIVTRQPIETDATLSSISGLVLSPAFSSGTTNYTATVPYSTKVIDTYPTPTDPNAKVIVNGVLGGPSGSYVYQSLNVGQNTVTIVVTAQDGVTTKTYTIMVTRQPAGTDATLSALTGPTLSPAFASGTTNYTSVVPYSTKVLVTYPTPTDANAQVTVNGALGGPSGSYVYQNLNVGANTVTIVVTAQDGVTTKTYTVTVTRQAQGTDATLSGISTSGFSLSPSFASNTTSYTGTVPYTTNKIYTIPTLNDPNATATINGATFQGTQVYQLLNVGANTVNIVVTAQDGVTKKTYTIVITRQAPGTDATLSGITTGSYTLSPAFTSTTTTYTAAVPYSTNTIYTSPAVNDPLATVTLNGNPYQSGYPIYQNLNVGSNVLNIVVTAQDGITTKAYTITITRANGTPTTPPAISDATLSNIVSGYYTLSPTFSSTTLNYTATVPFATKTIYTFPYLNDTKAKVTVNGVLGGSSGTSVYQNLNVGTNTVTILVTAEDGVTTKTYTITITRQAAGTDATLSSISTNNYALSPTFASGTTNYTATVPYATTNIYTYPYVNDPNASVTVNGLPGGSSGSYVYQTLNVGTNIISLVVTAQDGVTTKTYTITITRQPIETDATLSSIATYNYSVSPTFASATTNYTATVPYTTTNIYTYPYVNDLNATVTVNGHAGGSSGTYVYQALNVGVNIISIVVTAQDGITTKTYTITITRQAIGTDATLSSISSANYTLSPIFSSGTISYTATVPFTTTSIYAYPRTNDPNATVTLNGALATTYVYQPLNVGLNTQNIVVTAQDGITTKTYTVLVTRLPAGTDATLSAINPANYTISPSFVSGTTSYTATVPYSTSYIYSNPRTSDVNASVTLNGALVSTYVYQPLLVGDNTINLLVTAQDGVTTKNYSVIVTRQAIGTDATLTSIGGGLTLSPTFSSSITNYTATIPYTSTNTYVAPVTNDPNAMVTVNGVYRSSYSSGSDYIPMNVGNNTITIVVTAQDGVTTKTYTVVVNRQAPSSDATLSSLILNPGTLSPVFAGGTYSYTTTVPYTSNSITITPYTNSTYATLLINGVDRTGLSSGNLTVPLLVGDNTIRIVVTAQDGITTQTYTLIATRTPASNVSTLSSLVLNQGAISPAFSSATLNYTASLANSVAAVNVVPTATSSFSSITVNGTVVTSGGTSGSIPIVVGSTTISIVVTSQDGTTTNTYTLAVTRAPLAAATPVNAQVASTTLRLGAGISLSADSLGGVSDGVVVHSGVSPNGDGINDVFTIDGIESYPDNHLVIITRSGLKVFEANGYTNSIHGFDGNSNVNGGLLPAGTYFYVLDYKVGDQSKRKTGFIILKY